MILHIILLVGFVSICAASVDFNKLGELAKQRYGQEAFKSITALQQLIAQLNTASEAEKLRSINNFFNQNFEYAYDIDIWGQEDYWATPLELMGRQAGDCEDYVIAKYVFLKMLGVSNEKLRLTYVRAEIMQYDKPKTIAHMVLSYYATPQSEPLILDILKPEILSASDRRDLTPVFTFNDKGLWVGNNSKLQRSATAHLSRWRDVLLRMKADGIE